MGPFKVYIHRLEAVKASFDVGKHHLCDQATLERDLHEAGIGKEYAIWFFGGPTYKTANFMATLDADTDYVAIEVESKGLFATV